MRSHIEWPSLIERYLSQQRPVATSGSEKMSISG
jgi:hypothetical protein